MISYETLALVLAVAATIWYGVTLFGFAYAIKKMREAHEREIVRLEGALKYGDTQPLREAIPVAGEKEPEARLEQAFSEQAIQNGVARIKSDYSQLGIPITDEEARAQAIAALVGLPIQAEI